MIGALILGLVAGFIVVVGAVARSMTPGRNAPS
jgi:hypothetical protein